MINQYIERMGVELEGWWETREPEGFTHDGSVSLRMSTGRTGESVSPPFASFDGLSAYVKRNHPDRVNDTCGMHVHFSFPSVAIYTTLMERRFLDVFLRGMRDWSRRNGVDYAPFHKRIRGENNYTRMDWQPDMQVMQQRKGGPRYCHWNFCYNLHGTAECRLLPVFPTAAESVRAIRAVMNNVTKWLIAEHPKLATGVDLLDEEPETNTLPADVTDILRGNVTDEPLVERMSVCV